MKKIEALQFFLDRLEDEDCAVFCNGITAREGYMIKDRPRNFYMLASMGHAMMIGLGIAQGCDQRVVVFDGDGNFLMNPGGAAMVGAQRPEKLIHLIFDNRVYETTGNQASISQQLDLAAMAKGCGYHVVTRASNQAQLEVNWLRMITETGPHCLVIDVERGGPDQSRVIPMAPREMASRFRNTFV